MREKYTIPIYQKIALDLANKIYNGEVKEGSTLYGRSILAGKYNVSPETIRRAIRRHKRRSVFFAISYRQCVTADSW